MWIVDPGEAKVINHTSFPRSCDSGGGDGGGGGGGSDGGGGGGGRYQKIKDVRRCEGEKLMLRGVVTTVGKVSVKRDSHPRTITVVCLAYYR